MGFILFIVLLPSSVSIQNLFTLGSERQADLLDAIYCPVLFSVRLPFRSSFFKEGTNISLELHSANQNQTLKLLQME